MTETVKHALPKLPSSVEAKVITAANHIAEAFAEAGLAVSMEDGAPSQELYTVLYLLKLYCQQPITGEPGVKRDQIQLPEIASVLETIGMMMVSDKVEDYMGFDADWYIKAAEVIAKAEQEIEAQKMAIEKLLTKGLGSI